jgi:putative copper resistance protein D
MDAAALALALARGVQLAAVLSLFGTLLTTIVVARPALAGAPQAVAAALACRLARLRQASLLLAVCSAAVWLLLQAADMAGGGAAAALGAAPAVLLDTRFGHALLLRLGLLVLAAGLARHRRGAVPALLAGGIALAAQSWMGHPAAAEDRLLLATAVLHVLAAGAWLGGLVPLFLVVRAVPGAGAARAAERFSWIGCTAVLVATAFWQGW